MHSLAIRAVRVLHECSEWINDRRHGIRTAGFLRQAEAGVSHPDAEVYSATPYRVVRRLLRRLPPHVREGTFVDYGCGRGRVAILAAKHGFRRVVGVELSSVLLKQASHNRQAVAHGEADRVLFVQADAARFRLPGDATAAFWYRPFGAATTIEVLRRIGESLTENPRELWLLAYNSDMLEELAREHLGADVTGRGRTIYPTISWAVLKVASRDLNSPAQAVIERP